MMKYSVIVWNEKNENVKHYRPPRLTSFDFSLLCPPLVTFLSLRRCTRQVYNKSTLRLAVLRTLGGAGLTKLKSYFKLT